MKKVIVTTTINPPTESIKRFSKMTDWSLVVIGDRKTPDYPLDNAIYVTPDMQEAYDRELSDAIGWNCIQRRNFGLLWAHDMKADIVAVVDDDNIPYDHWGRNLLVGQAVNIKQYQTTLPAFDPIGATNETKLWHRGYPLELIPQRDYSVSNEITIVPDVQADFWNGDPDIDALCRMEHRPECSFEKSCFPFTSNALSPFNSQNTFISAKWLKDYFLFPHIGRLDDIWAAYYIEAKGAKVVYHEASVYQQRNVHDLLRDMKQEYIGYENNLKLVQDLKVNPESIMNFLPERSIKAFELYRKHFV
ncbi:MAG: hypothetical protein SGI71_02260 [Verrucomicrobiota bacterium]|nr:hypothetical protein [Verrucomicrobiota bacterium]